MKSFSIAFLLFFLLYLLSSDYCLAKIYKYKNKDGTWSFTDDASLVPDLKKAEERNTLCTELIEDLHKKLSETVPPKNKVEEARNGTVTIKNSLGIGSGFFITQDSGGPLITKDGEVVGINTWKVVGPKVEGIGFAIPITSALKEFERYLGRFSRLD